MLTLYVPGTGLLHRLPTGPKLTLLFAIVLAVSFLPSTWWAAATAFGVMVSAYAIAGFGPRTLARQLWTVRWVVVVMMVSQLIFLGPEPAIANTARVTSAIVIAGLLTLTTRITALLDTLERGMRPLRIIGASPERAAILLTVTITTIPVLAQLASQVREAQRARGGSASLRTFAVPFLILALKHADSVGDALTARGIR